MNPKTQTARADVYARITSEIITAIENGPGPWRAPWFHDGAEAARPTNVTSGRRYRGINAVALWAAGLAAGYSSALWATYRQWRDAGAQVREGERGTTVVVWKEIGAVADPDLQKEEGHSKPIFARAFTVFNLAQVEGYKRPQVNERGEAERIFAAEAFAKNHGIKTRFGGTSAYYRPCDDLVVMPHFETFRDAQSFYAVWLHELGHASGAAHRLNRDLNGRFGSCAYAAEECCVEILSGLVLADLAIAHHPRPDHAAYIATWLPVLKDDPRAIFVAASKAQQAADWMHAQQSGIATTPS